MTDPKINRKISLYLDLKDGTQELDKNPDVDIELLIKEGGVEYEYTFAEVARALGHLKRKAQGP